MKHFFVFVLLLSCSLMYAKETKEIVIATQSYKGATNRDGSGLYWDILKTVYEPLGYTIIKKYAPYNKAAQMLRSGKADLCLASYKDDKEFALYPKYYFDQKILIAMYNNESIEEWKGKKSLLDLNVGWVRGYDYEKYLNVKVRKQEMSNRTNGIKLLKNERIDVFIDDREDIRPYIARAKLNLKNFTKKIILQLKLYPAFSNNEYGRELQETWDERMKELIKTEAFKELYFNSEYTPFPY